MNRVALVVGGIIAIPLLVFLGLGFGHDPNVIASPLIGKEAPAFALRDFDGNPLELAAMLGKPVVLNFWASWCQPCVIEHPYLLRAAKQYEGRVSFIGVVPSEDREEAVNQFYSRFGSWGPAYHDSDGKVSIAYGVFKLPETYFIDAEGTIRYKHAGPLDPVTISETLEGLL